MKNIFRKENKFIHPLSNIYNINFSTQNEPQKFIYKDNMKDQGDIPDPADHLWLYSEPKEMSISIQQTTSLIIKAKETPHTLSILTMNKSTKDQMAITNIPKDAVQRQGSPFSMLRKSRSPLREGKVENTNQKPQNSNNNCSNNSKKRKSGLLLQPEDKPSTRATRYSINFLKEKQNKSKRSSPGKDRITSPANSQKAVLGKTEENILTKKATNMLTGTINYTSTNSGILAGNNLYKQPKFIKEEQPQAKPSKGILISLK